MGYFTDPYKWDIYIYIIYIYILIYWGYNPLILTFDPNLTNLRSFQLPTGHPRRVRVFLPHGFNHAIPSKFQPCAGTSTISKTRRQRLRGNRWGGKKVPVTEGWLPVRATGFERTSRPNRESESFGGFRF